MELFVTDLDGTLLNSNKEISEKSQEILNGLIDKGINFTVATARTPATVVDILNDVNLKLPVVLMNGVVIYDVNSKKYININEIEKETINKILKIFNKYNKNALVYGIKDDHLWVYYKAFDNEWEYNFYKERADKPLKTFVKVEDYDKAIEEARIINFVLFDTYDRLKGINDELQDVEGVTANFYEDVYEKDSYFLEVYSDKASKANGIKYLSKNINNDKLVCFGDNVNDIPMFELADEAYATSNAVDKLKSLATDVIGSCEEDGVAEYIKNRVSK